MNCKVCEKEKVALFRSPKLCSKCAASYFSKIEKNLICKGLELLKADYVERKVDGNIIDGVDTIRRIFE